MQKPHIRQKLVQGISVLFLIALAAPTVLAVGEPDPISDLVATPADGSVNLSWTIPNDNGQPVVSFIIYYDFVGGGFGQTIGYAVGAACPASTPGTACTIPVSSLDNYSAYEFRITMTNSNGESTPSNEVQATPTPCAPLLLNDDSGGPTLSESCLGVSVTAGGISIENIPDSLSFPSKFSSSLPLDSFSNDNPSTGTIDVATGPEDVLTIADLRNSGGFDVTITSTAVTSGASTIPLQNLYIATTCPDGDDLSPDLYGSPNNCDSSNGAEFADGSSGTGGMNQTSTVHSDNATGTATTSSQLTALKNAYTSDGKSFDAGGDTTPDTITLMQSTNAKVARLSQALNFYLQIPASQTAGTYNVRFTIDLIPN